MTILYLHFRRLLCQTNFHRVFTARTEGAPLRHIQKIDRRARNRNQLFAHTSDIRDGTKQALGIFVTRTIKNVLRRTAFTDASAVHHDDFITHICDDAEVMGYHNDRHPELLLQILHQLQNLCLNGNVQRRRRLIRDQNIRLTRKRHRDHHALPHTARKLIRILLDPLFRLVNADKRQHLDRARLRLFSFAARVQLDRLSELRPDGKDRI